MGQHSTTDFLNTLAPLALSGIGEGVAASVGNQLAPAGERVLPALPTPARCVIVGAPEGGAVDAADGDASDGADWGTTAGTTACP